jgi:hypothetical protein
LVLEKFFNKTIEDKKRRLFMITDEGNGVMPVYEYTGIKWDFEMRDMGTLGKGTLTFKGTTVFVSTKKEAYNFLFSIFLDEKEKTLAEDLEENIQWQMTIEKVALSDLPPR